MIPRVRSTIVVTGRAGHDIGLTQAHYAAQISVMRSLTVLRDMLGSLDRVESNNAAVELEMLVAVKTR